MITFLLVFQLIHHSPKTVLDKYLFIPFQLKEMYFHNRNKDYYCFDCKGPDNV